MAEPGPIDPAASERLRRLGGETLLRKMHGLFATLGADRVATARAAAASGDLEALERAAHSLKSSAGNVGAETLRQAAEALELEAERRRADRDETGAGPFDPLVERVAEAFDAARAALQEETG